MIDSPTHSGDYCFNLCGEIVPRIPGAYIGLLAVPVSQIVFIDAARCNMQSDRLQCITRKYAIIYFMGLLLVYAQGIENGQVAFNERNAFATP